MREQGRIFEKFYRLDPDMTGGIGGTGLGLYISRELVRRVEGRIWVEPNDGPPRGFRLPFHVRDSPTASASPLAAPQNDRLCPAAVSIRNRATPLRGRRRLAKSVANRIRQKPGADETVGMTVLIVDDHPSFRASARTLLESEGYEVVGEAENGADAVKAVQELQPDLVLLDVQLPDIDGFQVAEQLRRLVDPPAVVLTSSRDRADYGPCINVCGACGFVPKADLSGAAIAALLVA